MLYEKTSKQSVLDKIIDAKEALELKTTHNHYLDKWKKMKNTQFKVKDIFGDIIDKDNISQDKITKPNISSAELMLI